jgi:hypothetical protein
MGSSLEIPDLLLKSMQNPKKTPDSSDQMIILAIHRFSDPETS